MFHALTLTFIASTAAAQDWPEQRGPSQDGCAPEGAVFAAPFELRRAWSREIGAGYSGLVVQGETLVGTFALDGDDCVVALDAATGEERWRASLGPTFPGSQGAEDGPTSTPCIADGVVFAPGPRGRLLALDLADGTELWSVDLVQRFGARLTTYGFGASPVVSGDVLYLPIGTRSGTNGVAFDRHTGEVRWQREGSWVDYQSTVRFVEEGLLLAADQAKVSLLEAATGRTLFEADHRLRAADLAYPQLVPVEEDVVLFTYENEAALRRVDAATGELTIEWRSRELRQCYSPPVRSGNTLYGFSGTFLTAVDLATGARRWKSRPPGARGVIRVGEHLVMLSTLGEVVVAEASPEAYREAARVEALTRGGYTPPTFAHGRIYVRNTTEVACVEVHAVEGAGATEAASGSGAPLAGGSGTPGTPGTAGTSGPSGALETLAAELAELTGATARASALDTWWEATAAPLVDGDRVHFLYRGAAQDVALVGDMNHDRYVPDSLQRIPDTDLFFRTYECPPEGAWQYSFLVDYERIELDAKNPRTSRTVSDIAGNPQAVAYPVPPLESVFSMPDFPQPAFLDATHELAEADRGSLRQLPCPSRILRAAKELTVYLPAGYEEGGEAYPVVFVVGGDGWFQFAELRRALDVLMAGTCRRAIVVSLPYHAGSRDRTGGPGLARAVLEEAWPLVEDSFRTNGELAAFAAADDAAAVTSLAALAPGRFRRIAVQSPGLDAEDFLFLEGEAGLPEAVYVDWSRYEMRLRDENLDHRRAARDLVEHYRSRGVEVTAVEVDAGPGFPSWGARLGDVLGFLLREDG